jgi:hypothetical protein
MIESATLPVNYAAVDHPTEVEQRLRRLESAVAALQDTQLMEERVAERVVQKAKRSPLAALRDKANVVLDAGKALVPAASSPSTQPAADKAGWLLIDLWNEIRTFGKMLFDHRYPFSYAGRFGPVVIACTYVFCWMFLSGMPLIGGFSERVVDFVLAFILYKIMSREVQRYRAMFPA